MGQMSVGILECSLCLKEYDKKSERPAMTLKWLYYEQRYRDVGAPTQRRKQIMCPDCTESFIRWVNGRVPSD